MITHRKEERGFIALMSAIIITAILMLAIAALGVTIFYGRFNLLDSELKERSVAAADACADRALYEFAFDPTYTGSTYILNSIDQCRVGKVTLAGSTIQFSVQATSSGNSVTNLQIVANSGDLSVVSWKEVTNY